MWLQYKEGVFIVKYMYWTPRGRVWEGGGDFFIIKNKIEIWVLNSGFCAL